jgi:ABC-type phosphate transport system substrate-binding protein
MHVHQRGILFMKKWLIFALLSSMLLLPTANADIEDFDDNALMGAGAHFAWIVFDALKADLERVTGRETILFGQYSMLGVGCNAGIKAAKQHKLGHETFGFVCCPLSDDEINKNKLIVYPLAREPILILVRKDNPITNLTSQEVKDIFSGKTINWKEVGGPDRPIVVVTRLHCKKRPGHWKTILSDASEFRQERLNVKSASDMIQRVNDFGGAIGHTGSTWKFDSEDKVKWVSIDGFAPTAENLASGKYPFFRQMSAITNQNPSKDIVKLINEAQKGPAFRKVAKQYNLLPLNPMRQTTAKK